MATTTTKINKPLNPRGNDASPLAYNKAAIYSGKALDFDGVNDKVDITASAFDLYTLSFYFKGAIGAGTNGFVFHTNDQTNDGVAIGHITSTLTGETIVMGNNGIYTAISQSFDDGIYFITITWNATASKYDFYVNSQAVETFNSGSDAPLHSGVTNPKLGYRPSLNDFYLDGGLSNVRAFNTALTAAQIADLYNNPEKIVPTGVDDTALKLWLPMQEGAGTTAYDGSGNGNHGTISGATYVNGVGAPVAQTAVIDWNKGTNLLEYSEQFDNAYYSINNVSRSANETIAPDGQTTADKITGISTNDHYVWNTSIGLSGQNTISVFAKYNGYNIGLRPQGVGSGKAFANFDLQNGTILGSGGVDYDDSSITSFGDGWYRISLTLDLLSAYGLGIYLIKGTTATELPNFTADGTSGFYLWGAQVNAGATLTPYVRTGATAQTSPVLLPAGLTTGRDITGVNLFENVRKQGALNLDGNSWAEAHDNESLDFGSGMTLEAWIKLENLSQGILGKWNYGGNKREYYLYYVSSGILQAHFGHGASAQTATISYAGDGSWVHFVGTTDGSTITPYLNGVAGTTVAQTTPLAASDIGVTIGTDNGGNEKFINQLAQPRIYNRALTAEEVQRNYDAGKNTYTN